MATTIMNKGYYFPYQKSGVPGESWLPFTMGTRSCLVMKPRSDCLYKDPQIIPTLHPTPGHVSHSDILPKSREINYTRTYEKNCF